MIWALDIAIKVTVETEFGMMQKGGKKCRVSSSWMRKGTRNEPLDLLILPKVKCFVWFSSDGNSC